MLLKNGVSSALIDLLECLLLFCLTKKKKSFFVQGIEQELNRFFIILMMVYFYSLRN